MSEIMIPFNEWSKERLRDGRKTATSRRKPYGKIGDTFNVEGKHYVLIDVMQAKLIDVANNWYEFEGCSSPEEFKQIWRLIHRKMGFIPEQVVYLHTFEELDNLVPNKKENIE